VSILEVSLSSEGGMFSSLRTLRVLRIFKLVRRAPFTLAEARNVNRSNLACVCGNATGAIVEIVAQVFNHVLHHCAQPG
jgi:hypothetical protein